MCTTLVFFSYFVFLFFFFSSRRRHTRYIGDWSSDVCSSDLETRVYDQVLKHEGGERISSIRSEMQSTMDESVGIYREENGLSQATRKIGELKDRMRNASVEDRDHVFNTELFSALELDFMLDVAETIAYSALYRRESRGAHTRTDYTNRDDAQFLKHSMAYWDHGRPRIQYSPVTITRWQPEARVY